MEIAVSLAIQGWSIQSCEEKERSVYDTHAHAKSLQVDGTPDSQVEDMDYHCAERWLLEKREQRGQEMAEQNPKTKFDFLPGT
jgi:NhaP-type Na+/H+ and K+/H+ antiporter